MRSCLRIPFTVCTVAALVLAALPAAAQSALVVTPIGQGTDAEQMARSLLGPNVQLLEVAYQGDPLAGGQFTGGTGAVEFDAGVVLSTGQVTTLAGPNDAGNTSAGFGTPGHPGLDALVANPDLGSSPTRDAAVLTLDFVPTGDLVAFEYVFGSEEYTEFVGGTFNDVFAFYVNGANCATIATRPVSINNVNNEVNADQFVLNAAGERDTQLDGLTLVQRCEAPVVNGEVNHLELAIADVADDAYDSAVFIAGGSLSAEPLVPVAVDGDPATTEVANYTSALSSTVALSLGRWPAATFAGASAAQYAVLARSDEFADSLAGAPLAAGGPLLFTPSTQLDPAVLDEIERVLGPGGLVFLLGGEAALSQSIVDALAAAGFSVERLAGGSRVETAVAVADQVMELNPDTRIVAMARAYGPLDNPTAAWADSVTGGAWAAAEGVPILITDTESLHPAVQAWLDEHDPEETIVLGGTAALSEAVVGSLPNPRRVSGGDRAETAAAVAVDLFGQPAEGDRTTIVINGYRPDGWVFGLGAAGLAAGMRAPLLIVDRVEPIPPATTELLTECGESAIETLAMGSERIIDGAVLAAIDALDGQAC